MAKKSILLIHDWDYKKYTKMTESTDVWDDMPDFIREMGNSFNVFKVTLPGFCGSAEPKEKLWYLENYVDFIDKYMRNNFMAIDYVIGYGFGGAVALYWKTKYKKKIKVVLMSTKLFKDETKKSFNLSMPGIFSGITNQMQKKYAIDVLKIDEIIHGTPFLQDTYPIVTNVDLLPEVLKVEPEDITLIYGESDPGAKLLELYKLLPITYRGRISIIPGLDKNILINNPSLVIKNIVEINRIEL